MTDPRGYVRRGEPLAIAATQVNWINDQMRRRDVSQPPAQSLGSPYTWVYGLNGSGSDIERWAVMTIVGLEIEPTAVDTDTATTQFFAVPVLSLDDASVAGNRCVAIEPIPAGKVGRVAVAGVVQVHVADVPKLTDPVLLWSDDTWALVRLGGGLRLCKTASAFNKGTVANLDVWESGVPPDETQTDPSVTINNVVNKYANIAADKWVSIAQHGNGYWYVVAAECG